MTNHMHLILKLERRESLAQFLRELGGFLGRLFKFKNGLFSGRPFSRLLSWGKDYLGTHRYLSLNDFEKFGISKEHARTLLNVGVRPEKDHSP